MDQYFQFAKKSRCQRPEEQVNIERIPFPKIKLTFDGSYRCTCHCLEFYHTPKQEHRLDHRYPSATNHSQRRSSSSTYSNDQKTESSLIEISIEQPMNRFDIIRVSTVEQHHFGHTHYPNIDVTGKALLRRADHSQRSLWSVSRNRLISSTQLWSTV